MKLLFTDTHFGTKQNSVIWLSSQLDFIDNQLIPFIKSQEEGVDLIHLGDVFDSRSTISTLVATRVIRSFKELQKACRSFTIIGGNHDYYSPTGDDVDSLTLLLRDTGIRLVTKSIERGGDGSTERDLFVPWYEWLAVDGVVREIEDAVREGFKKINIYTHADIVMQSIDPRAEKYIQDRVDGVMVNIYTGHIHTPSLRPHKYNIGSCFSLDFNDANAARGFYTDRGRGLEFHPNERSIRFWRLYNDDIFDEGKAGKIREGDYIEIYVDQTNMIHQDWSERINSLTSSHRNSWVIPQVPLLSDDDSSGSDFIGGYDMESICRKMIPSELLPKFEQVIEHVKDNNK